MQLQALNRGRVAGRAPARSAPLPLAPAVRPARPAPCPVPVSGSALPNESQWSAARSVQVASAAGSTPSYTPKTEPTPEVLAIWQRADAVCFDVDCTVLKNDGLDLLAEFLGKSDEVARLTEAAMDGEVSLAESLEERLKIIDCKPSDIQKFLKAYPPSSRLVPGIQELIASLHARGVSVYLISGGFRELMLPVAKHLGIPYERVYANRMQWQWDDETGLPSRLTGFDTDQPTSRNQGKPEAISRIRDNCPYNTIVMIGDGVTDLEAVQSSHGADLFIGYGGVVERPTVAAAADWFIYDYGVLQKALKKYKVAVIGSGAWASAAARMVAQNTRAKGAGDEYETEVTMWVRSEYEPTASMDELQDITTLAEAINTVHVNPKYLPGVDLGENVVAERDLIKAAQDADLLVFCVPHQYMFNVCKQLTGHVKKDAVAISLSKGMRVRKEGPQLISQMVRRYMGIDCGVLMGANLAEPIAREEMAEAVVGFSNPSAGNLFSKLFSRPYFKVKVSSDPAGAELCGTLKNVVALGCGMVDGLGLGPNTKAAIIRQGLEEMRQFSKALYRSVRDDTFMESCGVGDLIATCYGGRNRAVAEEWTKRQLAGQGRTFAELEKEMLAGQKLQGTHTCEEVQEILRSRGWEADYPLFTTVYRIMTGKLTPDWILRCEEAVRVIVPDTEVEESAKPSAQDDDEAASGVVSPKKRTKKPSAPALPVASAPASNNVVARPQVSKPIEA